jgi:hypothetical protein
LAAPAGAQVTPGAVESFLAEVRPIWRSVTQAQSIYKLRRMAEILAPERDFSWLREIEKDLALVAYPRDRFDRIVTTDVLVEAGLALIKEAELAVHRRRRWRATQLTCRISRARCCSTGIGGSRMSTTTRARPC